MGSLKTTTKPKTKTKTSKFLVVIVFPNAQEIMAGRSVKYVTVTPGQASPQDSIEILDSINEFSCES